MKPLIAIGLICALTTTVAAQSEDSIVDPELQIHGFVSVGGFVSTANDYIGRSSKGSLELLEAGLNVSTEPAERLRFGMQLFARRVGTFRDESPRIDWAYGD